jgi:hypothetical protein
MPYILGFDLATKKDFSALCVLEQRVQFGYNEYGLKWIERLPHGISYPKQIRHVRDRVNTRFRDGGSLHGSALCIDQTGVGEAVVDMVREDELARYVSIWPVLITGGSSVTFDEARCCYHVPKRSLVSVVSKLFESGRIKMVPGLAFEQTLKTELPNFKAKITVAGNETFEAWRDSDTDDLVLSVALGCWLGENTACAWDGVVKTDLNTGRGNSLMAQLPSDVFLTDDRPANDPRFFGGRAPQSGMSDRIF